MTAHEQEDQRVFLIGVDIAGFDAIFDLRHHDRFAPPAGQLRAHVIGHASRRNVNEPAARIFRYAFFRPLHRRGDQRFLHCIFLAVQTAAFDRTFNKSFLIGREFDFHGFSVWLSNAAVKSHGHRL